MKKLTKIKLINWHGFYDETIDISGSVLFTGDNGSGKSTIVDALYFLLTGGEENKFNTAANESTKRTLETYMRGRVGTEGKEFLREENNLISHIALEFNDDLVKKYFVLGVVLEIQESRQKIGKTFYHMSDRRLNDALFCEENGGVKSYINYRRMEKILGKDAIRSLDYAGDSRRNIRKAIYNILQLTDKYYELLPKAIAFRPIKDIGEFVFQFLLPEKAVVIDTIRENIRIYNELQDKIINDEEKKADLEKITGKGDEYRRDSRESELAQGCAVVSELSEAESGYRRQTEKRALAEHHLMQEQTRVKAYQTELDQIKELIYSLTHNEKYLALQKINTDLSHAEEKKGRLYDRVQDLDAAILTEAKIAESIGIKSNFLRLSKAKEYEAFQKAFQKYSENYRLEYDQRTGEKSRIELEIENIKQEKDGLEAERDKLSKGLPSYKSEVEILMKLIQQGLSDQDGKPIKVMPLCELIEMREGEEQWRNAVEGYLNTRRFDLFVSDHYYDEALRIYEKYKIQYKIHGVGLVNSAKIQEREAIPGSLAEKIVTDSDDARKYVVYLMGNVMCVDSEDELKQHERAITRTVMVYQNKAARQTKQEIYTTPYIGRKASQIRLEQVRSRIEELANSLNEKTQTVRNLDASIREMHGSKISYIESSIGVWAEHDAVSAEIKRLKTMLSEAERNNDLIPKIERHRSMELDMESRIATCQKNINEYEFQIREARKNEQELLAEITQVKPLVEQLQSDPSLWNEIEVYRKQNQMSASEYRSRASNMKTNCIRTEENLKGRMQSYIDKYGFDATAQIDSLDVFYREYNEVILRDLAQFAEKLEETKQNASTAFKESYISEIRRHIGDEKKNINKLNHVLAQRPFGPDGEVYQFQIGRSLQREFGEYYDIFIGTEDFDYKDLFTSQLTEKNAALMQELFDKLTSTTRSDQQEKIIKDYTDYRKFMSYDIVITNKRGEKSYFSKLNESKSGGEIQTPFYVIIAASFDQIMHSGYGQRSPGCLVMFDEAFNNMDGERIRSLLEYYAELDIQPLIAVPTERAKSIHQYVTTIVALVKSNHRIVPKVHIKVS